MEINITTASKDEVDKFNKEAWSGMDLEHYGKHVKWVETPILFKVVEGGKIIAAVDAKYESGVIHVNKITVEKKNRRNGIGKSLMKKIEEEAAMIGAHKIFLTTGKDWVAGKFYESLGFEKTADLPNHFFGFDFVIYSKII
jgi:GNAT superfamily N-acetyltransferase